MLIMLLSWKLTAKAEEQWKDVSFSHEALCFSGEWTQDGEFAKFSTGAGHQAELSFFGTAVRWWGQKDINFGKAKVEIDGQEAAVIDTYGAAARGQLLFEKTGLPEETHSIRITNLGEHRDGAAADASAVIDIEKLQVRYDPAHAKVSSVMLSGVPERMLVGDRAKAIAVPIPFNGSEQPLSVQWQSSQAEIVTVDRQGHLEAKAPGSAVITVEAAGQKREATIQVAAVGELRKVVDNAHPLLMLPVYGKEYSPSGSELDWGDTLVGRWRQVPDDLKPFAAIELHAGGRIGVGEYDSRTVKLFYQQQLEIAKANQIPIILVVATAGQQTQYTGVAGLDRDWLEEMYSTYPNMIGIMSTENYWTSWQRVAERGSEFLEISARYGGYFIWSEHQAPVIEGILETAPLRQALEQHSKHFIFTWKNTPAQAYQNANTTSYMQGLWLSDMCAQWGGLIDTWKWFEKDYWKLFEQTDRRRLWGVEGGEEARSVVTEPEALLGIEMMNIYLGGGCVYNFEHPAYVYGAYDLRSPAFDHVVAQFLRYAIANPAPSKEDVGAGTKTMLRGNLSRFGTGFHSFMMADPSNPTYLTGRYGWLPAVPETISAERAGRYLTEGTITPMSEQDLRNPESRKTFFDKLYPELYQGDAFGAFLNGRWYLYNSMVNQNVKQQAEISLAAGRALNVVLEPHTYAILEQRSGNEVDQSGAIRIELNNYRTNKDGVWDGYPNRSPNDKRWDTDHNTLMQDWIRDHYIPSPQHQERRETVLTMTGLSDKPQVSVLEGMAGQYEPPVVTFQKESGTAEIKVKSNGWVKLEIREAGNEEPQPRPEPEKPIRQLTFDLNGGSLNGETGIVVINAKEGESITLPQAPTREGYRFTYWKGSKYMAGDSYLVQGDHGFTAQWEQTESNEKPRPDQQQNEQPRSDQQGNEQTQLIRQSDRKKEQKKQPIRQPAGRSGQMKKPPKTGEQPAAGVLLLFGGVVVITLGLRRKIRR